MTARPSAHRLNMRLRYPYREPGAWYWLVVDRRNGLSTQRRFPTREAAQAMADRLNGVGSDPE